MLTSAAIRAGAFERGETTELADVPEDFLDRVEAELTIALDALKAGNGKKAKDAMNRAQLAWSRLRAEMVSVRERNQ